MGEGRGEAPQKMPVLLTKVKVCDEGRIFRYVLVVLLSKVEVGEFGRDGEGHVEFASKMDELERRWQLGYRLVELVIIKKYQMAEILGKIVYWMIEARAKFDVEE